jgi:glycosyltransferase involved in cell wall biosynthesis
MRIAVFAETLPPELGGIAQSVLATSRILVRRGHPVLFAVARRDPAGTLPTVSPSIDPGEDVRPLRLPTLRYGRGAGRARAVIPTGLGVLGCRAWAPDLVHSHLPFGSGLEALAAARLLGVPLVGTQHVAIEEFVDRAPAGRLARAAARYVRWYYDRCDLVTAPSEGIIARLRRDGLRAPVRVVPDAASLDRRSMTRSRHETSRRFGAPGFALLHVGRLTADARVDEVIRAIPSLIARLPGVSLTVVGRGPAEPPLRALADALQVTTHVRFLGHVAPARLYEAYAASDVFVSMGPVDRVSLAMIDGMAAGLPVIAARQARPAHVDASRGLLVDDGDAAALADAILGLHRDSARAASLGAAAARYAARFSPELVATEWEEVYGGALARSRRPLALHVATPPSTPRA